MVSYTNMTETEKKRRKSVHIEAIKQMITLSTSGFGLVAALAWNNVIKDIVDNYINKLLPKGSGLLSLLLYAMIVTFLAVFITLQLSKLLEKVESR